VSLSERDRRALVLMGVGVAVVAILRFGVYRDATSDKVESIGSIPIAEKRLARLRQAEVSGPAKRTILNRLSAELAAREKGMIQAPTAQQAQAHLLETIRRVGKNEGVDVRGGDFREVRPLGQDYGNAAVSVNFECRIEQLVNFLAALTHESELVATDEVRVSSANVKEKTVRVRLTLAGVVPRALVPVKKGLSAF